ncbi:hypothetical protein DSO57_1039237 [Entomophthora muscae]|uniref:Uncharacterized protein n=1 Tax=Entomophthora muscae TaxID=34485 RepID=A0ACC2UJ48_9FUNG|nr:hypothetical protein DSO57_1039237 [Entomophthora muscae]
MNALVNILDNNLSAPKGAEIIAPFIVSETPKENELPTLPSDSSVSAPKFEPGLPFVCVDGKSSEVNVNLNLNQLLPFESSSSQSTINNKCLKRFVTKISDVGYNVELEDSQSLVSSLLLSVPSVVPAKVPSLLPSCVGMSLNQDFQENKFS